MNLIKLIAVLIVVATLIAMAGSFMIARGLEKATPPLGQFVDADGGRIHYIDMGPKDSSLPPVILIHGASVNARDMAVALGEPLSATRRVIAFDRPGRGYSARGENGWRIDEQARRIRDAARALGVEEPIVVGQSFGGAVALQYALQFQSEMSGLVLLAPVSHEWPGAPSWYNSLSGVPVAGVIFRRAVIPFYGPMAAKTGVPASFRPNNPPADYLAQVGLNLLFRPADFKANAEDLRRLKPQVVAMQPGYGALALPVAILTGDADKTVSPDIHSKTLARDIPGAKLTLLPGVGHALHHVSTDEIIAEIDGVSTPR